MCDDKIFAEIQKTMYREQMMMMVMVMMMMMVVLDKRQ